MSKSSSLHLPVLPREVEQGLAPPPGGVVVDGTAGGGGHTRRLAVCVGDSGLVVALDRDPLAIDHLAETCEGLPVTVAQANYADLPEVLAELELSGVDGILLDLGLSSDQLADKSRGFSFDADGPLDLRFDPEEGEPAWRLVNRLSAAHLADLIYQLGEERHSRRIARAIVEERKAAEIRTAGRLAEVVRRAVPTRGRPRIDPATRTFQALRIAVNDELKSLEIALRRIPECLKPGGRIAVISFHSLEDRRVKEAFRGDARYEPLTKKPIRPAQDEIAENPRARSAKLRVARRN
jgi:16S rRNA (cytosine1402-N4)-methyltransferase